MPTDYEYAYYAKEVYTTGGGVPLPGWESREVYYPERRWNFGMASYYHKSTRSLIIAFRGTESLWDLLADISLWQGHSHPTQGLADDLAKKAHDTGVASILLSDLFAKVVIEDKAVVAALLQQIIALIAASLVASTVMAGGAAIPGSNLALYLTTLGIAPQLATLLSSTLFGAGVGVVIAYDSLISYLTNNLRETIKQRESGNFVQLLHASLKKEEESSITSITFVGHSMGAYIAEMCSCRLKHNAPNTPIVVKSVTFDSPGSLDTLNGIEEYKLPNYNHMTTYLSAPNLVNTCHLHAGEVRRVYVPHVEKGWTWSHFGYSLWQSAARSIMYVGIPVSAFLTGGASVPLSIASGGLVAKAGGQALHIITKDRGWLIRQHSIQNILSCFSKDAGLPRYYSIMAEWPHSSSFFTMGLRQAGIFLKGLWPFPDDAPGIRTIFAENHMNELQLQRLPGYRVYQDIFEDIKEVPDWANSNTSGSNSKPGFSRL